MNMLHELGSIVLDTSSLGGFTDDEFYQFCLDNKDLKFERDAESNIIVMANTGGKTGQLNAEVLIELGVWNRIQETGICFDSSTAFKLPNGAVRSPDAAWLKLDRWVLLTEKEREQFPPVCPDFLIEIKSPSDNLQTLKSKMEEWVANGCTLCWLVHPQERVTDIYYKGEVKTLPFDATLTGNDVLEGFEIKLSSIFK